MKIIIDVITLFVEVVLSFLELCLRIPQLLLQQVAIGMAQRLQRMRTAIKWLQEEIENYRKIPVQTTTVGEDSVALALPEPFATDYHQKTHELRMADRFVLGCIILLVLGCCCFSFIIWQLIAIYIH